MSWLNRLRNHMRQEAQRAMADVATPRAGVVTNYDPTRYCARVMLQPEGILTGYLPITSMWVGNGWGMFSPPSIGEVVDVHFHQGGKEAAYIVGRFYSAQTKPVPVASGEFWLVHQTGGTLTLANDGSVTVSANTNMTLNAPNGTFRVAAENIKLHATQTYAFDCNGQGQKWNGSNVETWQDNDTTGGHHDHAPPETPS
jgi:phage baseplate assembly protein gpV